MFASTFVEVPDKAAGLYSLRLAPPFLGPCFFCLLLDRTSLEGAVSQYHSVFPRLLALDLFLRDDASKPKSGGLLTPCRREAL